MSKLSSVNISGDVEAYLGKCDPRILAAVCRAKMYKRSAAYIIEKCEEIDSDSPLIPWLLKNPEEWGTLVDLGEKVRDNRSKTERQYQ